MIGIRMSIWYQLIINRMGNQAVICCSAHQGAVEKDAHQINAELLHGSQSEEARQRQESEGARQDQDYGSGQDQKEKVQSKIEIVEQESHPESTQPIKLPKISETVSALIQNYGSFRFSMLQSSNTLYQVGNSIYQGTVDQRGKPSGFGAMYHENGSVFIGEFEQGVAEGEGFYAMSDGSYYRGKISNSQANDDHAYYKDKKTEYTGSIRNNRFEGQGHLKRSDCEFTGLFEDHRFKRGTLRWREKSAPRPNQWVYKGEFDNNQKFTGHGYLKCPKGEYEGPFRDGLKHGKGIFSYKNHLKYEGEYIDGVKQGNGTIIKDSGNIAYSGDIESGLPHGIGFVMEGQKKVGAIFEKGVNRQLIKSASPIIAESAAEMID